MSTKRSSFFFGFLIVLVALGAYWLRDSESRVRALRPDAGPKSSAHESGAASLANEERAHAKDTAKRAAVLPTTGEARNENPAEAESTINGRVVLRDRNGQDLEDCSGTLILDLHTEGGWGRREIEFHDGRWSTAFDPGKRYLSATPRAASVEGDVAHPIEPKRKYEWRPESDLTFHFFLPPRATLHVLDAETGFALSDITVVKPDPRAWRLDRHPGLDFESRVESKHLNSPIELKPELTLRSRIKEGDFFVGAPGYAWARVAVDYLMGGEQTLRLPRSASLALSVQSIRPGDRPVLRLRQNAGRVFEVVLTEDRNFTLEGLLPGPLVAVAEFGERWDARLRLAEASAELHVGELTNLTLQLKASPTAEFAPGSGLLLIAEEWKMTESGAHGVLELLGVPLSGFSASRGITGENVPSPREGYDAFRWTEEKLQVGAYHLGVYDLSSGLPSLLASVRIDLPPEGRDDFELVIPPPSECFVRVFDDKTGLTVPIGSLFWNVPRASGVNGGTSRPATFDEEREVWIILSPTGEFDLSIRQWPYVAIETTLLCDSSSELHTLRLVEATCLTIRFFDGETPLPFPESWDPGLMQQHGPGFTSCRRPDPFEMRYQLTKPGTYTVTLPTIEGYEPQEPLSVEVEAGRLTEVVVPYRARE